MGILSAHRTALGAVFALGVMMVAYAHDGHEDANVAAEQPLFGARCHAAGFPTRYDELIMASVRKHFPPDWQEFACDWRAQLAAESSLDAATCEQANAVGARCLAQIMPDTAAFIEAHLGPIRSRTDAKAAIYAGAWYMAHLGRIYIAPRPPDDRLTWSVASYNSGPGWQIEAQRVAQADGRIANDWDEAAPYLYQVIAKRNADENTSYVARWRKLAAMMRPE